MTSSYDQKPGIVFAFLLFLVLGLFSGSCGQRQKQDKQQSLAAAASDTLPNILSPEEANQLIDYFKASDGQNVDDNFFFDGKLEQADKAISFQFNADQTKSFFDELDRFKKNHPDPKDSIRIRIHVAFRGKTNSKWPTEPNLAPLVELVSDQAVATEQKFYPLRPFKSNIIPFIEQFNPDTSGIAMVAISAAEAKDLVKNWSNIPVDQVTEQLYLDNKRGAPGGRIRYYTFDAADTDAVYRYLKNLATQPNASHFYVHLGQLQERDYVALRTVIHLSSNALNKSNPVDRFDVDDEYFEFSRPCPNYCH